ncbi:apolipoprotein N-acyltransferase [Sedimenticola hydrogenitrophicus]|uniref:apolipoprotein N-acyltransferase n=1 Tax=Sedimenticola hydrogenitrophicus TaxID=2967975 RepID=UPI0023AFE1B3|nr:apolipoprotein N-acyltransferase [Sedimenticola hydrogenitrophicus]
MPVSPSNRLARSVPWRLPAAFAAGALSVLGFAPFSLYPLALAGPLLLLWLWRDASPRSGFQSGWAYGLGLLGFGVFWLHISIDQFGNLGTAAAIALTLLFVLALALYYGLVGWLTARLWRRGGGDWSLLLTIPSLWVLGEWLRGWILTGFPWLVLGYSQIDSPLGGYAPLFGVYGVSWLLLLSVALLFRLLRPGVGGRRWLGGRGWLAGGLVLLWGGGALLHQVQWTEPAGEPLQVSMIQGNIAQEAKWQRDSLRPTLALYTGLTREQWQSDLIIWPETAVPAFAHQVEETLLQPLAAEALANRSELLIGIPQWDGETGAYYNAMLSLGQDPDQQRGSYAKRHLVPFGEFMPLKRWLRPLVEWLQIPMSDFTPGDSPRPLLRLAGYYAGISICYEDAFGEEVIEALPQAAFLVNASNDAWFGDSLAPRQHLEMARMRALESGRYLLRSTNTGISALIDPKGKVQGFSPAFQQHVLSGEIIPMQGATPYVRVGNWAVVLFSCLLVLVALLKGGHRGAPLR